MAMLMLHGKLETRYVKTGKKPPFPLGPYLIYSTKKRYSWKDLMSMCGVPTYVNITGIEALAKKGKYKGVAICTCDLVEIIDPLPDGHWDKAYVTVAATETHRPVGLRFENVKAVRPFKIGKGKQGVGWLAPDLEKLIVYDE